MTEQMQQWVTQMFGSAASGVLSAVIYLVIGILAIRILRKVLEAALNKSKLEKAAHGMILSLANFTMCAVLIMIVASSLGIDTTSVVALASVVTLAVSMSMQSVLTNVVGGFIVLTTHPFRSGDYVDVAGQSGIVQEIGMTYTRLLTLDNKTVSIPNSAVAGSQVVNYSNTENRRVDFSFSASYDTPVQTVLDALAEAAQVEGALTEPAPFTAVEKYDSSTINYVLRVWTKNANYWDVYFGVNKKVKEVFELRGVKMSYPHVNVHVEK